MIYVIPELTHVPDMYTTITYLMEQLKVKCSPTKKMRLCFTEKYITLLLYLN